MNEYDFILNNLRFSYSSVSSFSGCKYGFKLSYIDAKKRKGNAFSEYGLLVHEILEKYFSGELELWDLEQYYIENYHSNVVLPFPPYPKNMAEKYYEDGLNFFKNFSFDKSKYDVVIVEDSIKSNIEDIELVVKPDLVLFDKEKQEYVLYDYKTARMRKHGALLNEQIHNYMKQFQLYAHFLWVERNIEIKKIKIWFIRDQKEHVEKVVPHKVFENVEWFKNTIDLIKNEETWTPNLDKSNEYFCYNLCGVSEDCEYHQKRISNST